MKLNKVKCGECGRKVGVLKNGTLVRHKIRKGSKNNHTRCPGGGS